MASALMQDLPEPSDPTYQYQYDTIKNATAIAYLGELYVDIFASRSNTFDRRC
jgi:hypothetical protein